MEKIKIYIVEDYFLTRISYKHTLGAEEDFDITGDFETAEECLEAMERETADIILMDLGLPFMNGIEATRILSEKYPKSKVIVLTSHEEEKEILACIASGASGYALKESDFETLKRVIRMVHFGALWFDPQIAGVTKTMVQKPNSTNFDNLYKTESDIKNVLTDKELSVLKLVSEGKSNIEIGEIMMISQNTAKVHVANILNKLSVKDRVQAAVAAVKARLI